jgi:hypothetical protein
VRKRYFDAKRSFNQEMLMNTEFLYKGPLRKIGFRYSGPPWVFVMFVLCLAIAFWMSFW